MDIRKVLEFNKKINTRLQTISEPLRKIGITTFAHSKYLPNGKAFRISTNLEWSTLYFKENFHIHPQGYQKDIEQHTSLHNLQVCLWKGNPTSPVYSALKENNIWNGLTLCEKDEDSVSGWSFGTAAENDLVLDFCIENLNVLKHFVLYFKSQCADILDTRDTHKLYTLKAYSSSELQEKGTRSVSKKSLFLDE